MAEIWLGWPAGLKRIAALGMCSLMGQISLFYSLSHKKFKKNWVYTSQRGILSGHWSWVIIEVSFVHGTEFPLWHPHIGLMLIPWCLDLYTSTSSHHDCLWGFWSYKVLATPPRIGFCINEHGKDLLSKVLIVGSWLKGPQGMYWHPVGWSPQLIFSLSLSKWDYFDFYCLDFKFEIDI